MASQIKNTPTDIPVEEQVARHYTRPDMLNTILSGIKETAKDPDHLTADDLKPYDNMHVGGPTASRYLFEKLTFKKGMTVLDIGSGRGGPARQATLDYGVEVTGIDLTPEYKIIAIRLSELIGLTNDITFITGSALDLPFDDGHFDCAYSMHVCMNIKNKKQVYSEAFRALKPGGLLGIYDIMAGPNINDLRYPVPWADTKDTSFLTDPDEVKALLSQTGFEILDSEQRKEFSLTALEKVKKTLTSPTLPTSSSAAAHTEGFGAKIDNLIRNIEQNRCCPWQIICQKPA